MQHHDTVEKVEKFTDKYIWKMPNFTVAEYAVMAIICFLIAKRLS